MEVVIDRLVRPGLVAGDDRVNAYVGHFGEEGISTGCVGFQAHSLVEASQFSEGLRQ